MPLVSSLSALVFLLCPASLTAAPTSSGNANGYCSVLDEEFNGSVINPKIWKHEVTMSGGGNWEFEWYTNNRSNSFTKDGSLYLMPTFTFDHIGPSMINGGQLDLWSDGCTQNGFYGCSRSSNGNNIINPIQSAKVTTIDSVSIGQGSKIEVRAKLPIGDWIWPAIWLLPKDNVYGAWPASGEIDIMESRGNAPGCAVSEQAQFPAPDAGSGTPTHGSQSQQSSCVVGRDTFGSTLHWGPDFFTNRYPQTTKSYTLPGGKALSDDFHVYGLLWTNDSLITYIDDPSNVVLSVPLANFYEKGKFPASYASPWPQDHPSAPFDQEFYLILNVAVGGTNGYFPETPNKPWNNKSPRAALDFWNGAASWLPSWPKDLSRAMVIDSVKMWKQC